MIKFSHININHVATIAPSFIKYVAPSRVKLTDTLSSNILGLSRSATCAA